MSRTTVSDQLYRPEGSPDDFQRSLEREEQKNRKRYAIQFPRGEFVHGFNRGAEIVQTTTERKLVKEFASRGAAQKFIDQYGDAGYGLVKINARIVEIA